MRLKSSRGWSDKIFTLTQRLSCAEVIRLVMDELDPAEFAQFILSLIAECDALQLATIKARIAECDE